MSCGILLLAWFHSHLVSPIKIAIDENSSHFRRMRLKYSVNESLQTFYNKLGVISVKNVDLLHICK